jgi:hypothetical protein
VKVVYSDGTLGKNIGFVIKDEGAIVQAWWRDPDNSCALHSNRKISIQIVNPSPDDESWVELRGLASLVKY